LAVEIVSRAIEREDGRHGVDQNRLRAVIVGVGPAGGVLAAFLLEAGHEVVLVDTAPGLSQVLRERGLRVTGSVERHAPVWRVYASAREVEGWDPDVIIVSTKAPVVPLLCPDLERAAGSETLILSYQNGIDTEAPLVETFGPAHVARAVVRYGANLVEPGHFRMTFWHRPNYLGGLGAFAAEAAEPVADAMTACGLPTELVEDIRSKVWEKAIANALNSVCGLTGLSIGGVLDVPALREVFVKLLEERIAIARAAGLTIRPDLLGNLITFHERARAHLPSSYADIQQGLSGEVDWIEGKFVEYARILGLAAPIDLAILGLVKGRTAATRAAAAAAPVPELRADVAVAART
jgi:2-dehydropantoate 2-reductase